MKNYEVSVYVTECQTDTFKINASDIDEARALAGAEAIARKYDVDDIIDVVEIDEEDSESDTFKKVNALKEGERYLAITKNGEKVRVFRNYEEDIENKITGIITIDDNYTVLFRNNDHFGWQDIEYWFQDIIEIDASPESDIEQDRRCHS